MVWGAWSGMPELTALELRRLPKSRGPGEGSKERSVREGCPRGWRRACTALEQGPWVTKVRLGIREAVGGSAEGSQDSPRLGAQWVQGVKEKASSLIGKGLQAGRKPGGAGLLCVLKHLGLSTKRWGCWLWGDRREDQECTSHPVHCVRGTLPQHPSHPPLSRPPSTVPGTDFPTHLL